MKLKTCLSLTIALFLFNTAMAQDKIYKRNGDMISVKVKEVSGNTISYKKTDNPDGPTYTVNKRDIERIEYSNGSEDNFADDEDDDRRRPPMARHHMMMKEGKHVHYGNNILSVSPMQITEQGVGVGIAYERALDKENILSFYLPFVVAFNNEDFNNNTATVPPTTTSHDYNTYYVMPGIKFYPTGGKGKVRYAVGPNIVAAFSERYVSSFIYNNTGTIIGQDVGWKDHFSLGMIINNSLNINPTAHLHLGLEMGIGLTYLNRTDGKDVGQTDGYFQFGFKVGYRF